MRKILPLAFNLLAVKSCSYLLPPVEQCKKHSSKLFFLLREVEIMKHLSFCINLLLSINDCCALESRISFINSVKLISVRDLKNPEKPASLM